FSLRPNANRAFPARSILTRVVPGTLDDGTEPPELRRAVWGIYDTARRPTAVFDGMITQEFLVELPTAHTGQGLSFRDAAGEVAGRAVPHDRPIAFMPAPGAAPREATLPRGVTGSSLRIGVAFRPLDDSGQLAFGTSLIDLCGELG